MNKSRKWSAPKSIFTVAGERKPVFCLRRIVEGLAFLFFLPLLGASPENRRALAPELDALRPGLLAYGDLWPLCFWRDGLRIGQSSSHDEQDRNIDLMHFHGWDQGGRVLARLQGPGVVYRVWSANPSGELEFWTDESKEPVISCDFQSYLLGDCAAEKAFAVGRYANYTPLPFRKSLLIIAKHFKLAGAYYQITYMTFDHDPGLATLTAHPAQSEPAALDAAERVWRSNGRESARDPGGLPLQVSSDLVIPPGEKRTVLIQGPGLVTELKLYDPENPREALSELWLRVFWDWDQSAAVDSPADALFGNRFNAREKSPAGGYETLAVSATTGGYSMRWPMPFNEEMRLTLENRGDRPRSLRVELAYRGLEKLPQNAMRFHALYREQDYPDDLAKENIYGLWYRVDQNDNYVVLDRKGQGYYAGCFLFVRSLGTAWWGEGDEMIWVDDDPQAVIRGTGTEDEFNWSYGFKENRSPISGALLVPHFKKSAPQTAIGYNVLYRFRPGDFAPFRERIKVTYERLASTWIKRYPGALVNVTSHRGDDYRSVAYWYELPEGVE